MPKSVRFDKTGGPEVLTLVEVPTPEPKSGEVRIKVKAIGLNRAEVMYRSGVYLQEPQYPAQLGYEASGQIDAVGPDVTGFQPGDKVSVVPAFSFRDYGLYGEVVLAPARATVKNPEGQSWEEAAATWMQYVTVWGAVIDLGKLGQGDTLLIPAASSSVGLAAIQVARRVGAVPVALTRTSVKVASLKEAGASHVIATEEQDLVEEVMALTDGQGARVVFDPVGGPTFEKLAKATAKNGILFLYGALGAGQPTTLPLLETLGNHLTIRGYELFEVTSDDAKLEEAKRFVTSGLASGDFRPLIAKTFPFENIVDAHRYLESNAQIGKVVVTV